MIAFTQFIMPRNKFHKKYHVSKLISKTTIFFPQEFLMNIIIFHFASKRKCKPLLPDLMKNGVQCDLRLLHVGDLLWIARERLGPQIDRYREDYLYHIFLLCKLLCFNCVTSGFFHIDLTDLV